MEGARKEKRQRALKSEWWKVWQRTWRSAFSAYTGHDAKCLENMDCFMDKMFEPTDAASLGVGRMLFGLMMLIDIPDERGGGDLDLRWGEPRDCRFPLLPGLVPLCFSRMALTYFVMWLGALGIALGYRYRVSCLMFVLPYWYIFLLDKSSWNNHSYLFGLLGLLFSVTEANRFCSLDALRNDLRPEVPFWNYFILKFQFFLLYFYAGIKKFNFEWLSGYAMTNLGYHWVFTPFRALMGAQLTDLLIIHWFACLFDLSVAFFLVYHKTRVWATPFCVAFHLMNSRLFRIGMFPWTCLVELPLFYEVDWPRKVVRWLRPAKSEAEKAMKPLKPAEECSECLERRSRKARTKRRKTLGLMGTYVCLQLLLPFSHSITKGYNSWTKGLYGYSWDMMCHAWDTVLVSVKVIDNSNSQVHYLEPYAYSESDRWTTHPDMAHQYAQCIAKNLQDDFHTGRNRLLKSDNLSINFDVWTSINGRSQQRYFDPTVDLVLAPWHPFRQTPWVLPLLEEFTGLRPALKDITKHVLSWNNHTDVLFIADFPGLQMSHFIPEDLDNVTLTVLEGVVSYSSSTDRARKVVRKGGRVDVLSGMFHRVEVLGDQPANYMLTFLNKTLHLGDTKEGVTSSREPILPLWTEFSNRAKGLNRFMAHVGNAILHETLDFPMPRRVRKTND